MSNQHRSDLDIAKDLEKLSDLVAEAIQKATRIWEQVQETDAFKDLIEQMEQATKRLQSEKKFLEDIKKSALETLQNAIDINSELQNLKDLPNMINQLGITSDLLSEIQLILTEARQVEDSSKYNLANIEAIQQRLKSIDISIQIKSQKIDSSLEEIKKISLGLEDLMNLPNQLNQLGINENVISDIHRALVEFHQESEYSNQSLAAIHNQIKQDIQQSSNHITNEVNQYLQDIPNLIEIERTNIETVFNSLRSYTSESENRVGQLIQNGVGCLGNLITRNEAISTEIETLYQNASRDIAQFQNLIGTEKANIETVFNSLRSYTSESENRVGQLIQNGVGSLENLIARNKAIFTEIDTKSRQVNQTNENIEASLLSINQIILEIGGIEAFKSLLDESKNMRILILETRQEVIAIRSLENYITEFRRHRNHRELIRFLWNELGFLGVLIYLLRLMIPKNRRGTRG